MDAHSIRVLEFYEIVSMLRERTACALGDDEAQRLLPVSDPLSINEWQKETTEAKIIITEEGSFPLGGIHDIREYISKATLESLLQPSELQEILDTVIAARVLKGFVFKRTEQLPKLTEIAANITVFQKIEEGIAQTVGLNGEIKDSASPELARIRSRLKTLHIRIMDKLHSIVNSADYRTMIQDSVITQRGDRYCIPVKAEFRPQFHGIVHDSSASGATVFIEPASVVDMGNELKELVSGEKQEIEKILRRLTNLVKASAQDMQITAAALGRLDFISAKAKLSCDINAEEPIMGSEKLDLLNARHPLLKGEVVPISVRLGGGYNTLLITGPNTGGKTVTLKTVGLLTLMAHSGLHVSADSGTKIPIYNSVFADIGDEQSIQQSLSTFSAHLKNIIHIIKNADKNSLVLLDELGAGTDPDEGAALAKAIIDALLNTGAMTIGTTHYGELKEFAYLRDGVENASVEFDIQTLQPTYRLMIGIPGSSNAFAIASRLGLPDEIVESARAMVNNQSSSDDIIRKIEASHRSAAEKEILAARASKDAEILRNRYEERLYEVEAIKREIKTQMAEEFNKKIRDKVAELDIVLDEIKSHKEEPKTVHEAKQIFKEQVAEIEEEIDEMMPVTEIDEDNEYIPKAGDNVRLTTYNLDGVLLNDQNDDEAQVMVGSIKINVPFSTLKPLKKSENKAAVEKKVYIPPIKTTNIPTEIKLIAQRVEPALITLDKYLDDAFLAGLTSARIIHGKGTGTLKNAVWEFLSTHHAVDSYHLADAKQGGSGATIVEFRK